MCVQAAVGPSVVVGAGGPNRRNLTGGAASNLNWALVVGRAWLESKHASARCETTPARSQPTRPKRWRC
eukprot:1189706-Alexandrium_andersonii.AAC.1